MRHDRHLRIVRHESDAGRWELARARPHPALAGLVAEYQGYIESGSRPVRRRELPSGEVVLIINFGPAFRSIDRDSGAVLADNGSFVAGLHDVYEIVESAGSAYCLQVNFSPIGAYRFFQSPMHTLAGQTTDIGDVFGAAAERLTDALYSAPDWERRFEILDAHLGARIAGAREPSADVIWAWNKLRKSHGALSIGAVADELAWSRKRLVRQFRDQIGVAPKTAARILRFRHALDLIEGDATLNWADIAAACGYADQSHMIKEFGRLAGYTPRELSAIRLPDGAGFVES